MTGIRSVLVVGAGIGGMTLAAGLQRKGIRAEIVEISDRPTVQGVGIALMGPTLRALKTIGLIDACVAAGFGINDMRVGNAQCEFNATVDLPRLNGEAYPAFAGIMRPVFQRILADAAEEAGARTRRGLTVASLDDDGEGVDVAFTDGTRGRYDLVVGADGIGSRIRELVFDPGLKPRLTGQSVWRATLDRPAAVDTFMMFYGPRNKAGFNPVSSREMYVFLVQNTPDNPRIPEEKLPETIREQLADFGGIMGEARERIVDPAKILYRPIEVVIAPPPWHKGRVVLIGDAAHATTPHLASGAGMAIEDAIVLAEELASDIPLGAAMDNFMDRRYERSRMVYENSIQLGEWEKDPAAPGADPVGLTNRSLAILAQPL